MKRAIVITLLVVFLLLAIFFPLRHIILKARTPKLLRDPQIAAILISPDSIQVFQTLGIAEISTNALVQPGSADFRRATGVGITLAKPSAGRISALLGNSNSYERHRRGVKQSIFMPEFILRFHRNQQQLDLFVCLDSADIVIKSRSGEEKIFDVAPIQGELKQILARFQTQVQPVSE